MATTTGERARRSVWRRRLGTIRRLEVGDWVDLGRAWWLLTAAWIGLRWLSFDRLDRLLARPPRAGRSPATEPDRLARLVDLAARIHPLSPTCLPRALALRRLLAGRGLAAELRIGVRRDADGLAAHAWLEHDGRVIGEPAEVPAAFARLLAPRGPR